MKIAQIVPIIERVPPQKYGGTERVVHELTEELVKRGHEVTLFASGDSQTSAKLISIYPKSLRATKVENLYGTNILTMHHIGTAYDLHREFDIIHDHCGYMSLPTAHLAQKPVIMTEHGFFTPELKRMYRKLKNPYVISISKSQVKEVSNINLLGTVYNGLSMEEYPISQRPENYVLFVGRISMEKGVHRAIEAALYLNIPLVIAAKLDPRDEPYFKQYVKPYLSETIVWVGEVDAAERNSLMSRARCLLHPVTWREPFGLVLIEAMACGCPVIGYNKGSISEIIEQGKTGFVVQDIDELIDAIEHSSTISRSYCRDYALNNFNAQKMVNGYETFYQQIIDID